MRRYNVKLTLKLEKEIEVYADSGDEAIDKVMDAFSDTDLIKPEEMNIHSITCNAKRAEDICEDCDDDYADEDYSSERESLYDELY